MREKVSLKLYIIHQVTHLYHALLPINMTMNNPVGRIAFPFIVLSKIQVGLTLNVDTLNQSNNYYFSTIKQWDALSYLHFIVL